MEFRVIIPARYESTRLVGKALIDIAGKPMIQHVYERARESGAESVVIATDSEAIATVARNFGAEVCMTLPTHQSGTERLAEAVEALEYDDDEIIINLQSDEPLLPPAIINQLAKDLGEHDHVKIASVCEPIQTMEDLMNPNNVKVVLTRRHYAMYFSRLPIPWHAALNQNDHHFEPNEFYFRHVGIYAYRVEVLRDYINWVESPYESLESLEQLRALWNGHRIYMCIANTKLPPDVNTQEDLDKIRKLIS